MTITTKIKEKIENYRTNVLMAVDFLSKGFLEDAAVRFRKSAESYMKIVIYEQWGDERGHRYIIGDEDKDGNPQPRRNTPMFSEMRNLCYRDNQWIDGNTFTLLDDIRIKSNNNAHDPNERIVFADLKCQLEDCMELSRQLTVLLYNRIGLSVPLEVTQAYESGVVEAQTILALQQADMESFVENVDFFDKSSRYVLVAPFSMGPISKPLMRNLRGVRWSVIIDFDCHTKDTGGLYDSMMPDIEDNCTPFDIK